MRVFPAVSQSYRQYPVLGCSGHLQEIVFSPVFLWEGACGRNGGPTRALVAWEKGMWGVRPGPCEAGLPLVCVLPDNIFPACGKACWGTPCGKYGKSLALLSCIFSGPPSSFVLDIVLIYSFFPSLPSLMEFKQPVFPLKRLFSCLLIWSPLLSSSRFTSQKGHQCPISSIECFLDKCQHLISPPCVIF